MYRALQYYAVANCDNRTQVHWDTSTLGHKYIGDTTLVTLGALVTRMARDTGWWVRTKGGCHIDTHQLPRNSFCSFHYIYLSCKWQNFCLDGTIQKGGWGQGSHYINACHKARYLLPFSRHYIVDSPKLAKKVREGCSKGFQDQNFLVIVVN